MRHFQTYELEAQYPDVAAKVYANFVKFCKPAAAKNVALRQLKFANRMCVF